MAASSEAAEGKVNPELLRGLLLSELEVQRKLMIEVATGTQINTVNDQYIERHFRLRDQLATIGVEYVVPFADLWEFRDKWLHDLPSYRDRRRYISDLFRPMSEELRERGALQGARMFPQPTGWQKLDGTVALMRARLEQAKSEVEWQGVGHVCRLAHRLSPNLRHACVPSQMARLLPGGKDVSADLCQRALAVAGGEVFTDHLCQVARCEHISWTRPDDGRAARSEDRIASKRAED